MSYYRPIDPKADKRAETTGEDTYCICGNVFSSHVNGKCPKK